MRARNRLLGLVFGGDLDPLLRRVLVAQFAATVGLSGFWYYVGIWAIKSLGAGSGLLGATFLVDAAAGAAGGYIGGHLSDRLGRKPLILFGWGGQALLVAVYPFVDHHVYLGLALIPVTALVSGPALSSAQALIADVVPPEAHEAGYAANRVSLNLAVVIGPSLAALFLLGESWRRMFLALAALEAVAFVVGWRTLPVRGPCAGQQEASGRSPFTVIRRDRVFLVFLASAILAYVVYFGFETVLPIVAVSSYGLSPSAWGFLVVMNAGAVALLQIRLTRRVEHVSATVKLLVALPLMGFSFLLLLVNTSVVTILVVLLVFVLGEMLWAPTSQAIAARLAPVEVRGAYMGAYGTASSFGFALGPLCALQLRGAVGDATVWLFLAGASVVAAVAGAAAARCATPGPSFRVAGGAGFTPAEPTNESQADRTPLRPSGSERVEPA